VKPYQLECGSLDARISTAYDTADRRRSHELARLIREDGHCKFCGHKLNEELMIRTPGVCGSRVCKAKARG
jgi:hypothetical protein